MKRFLAVVIFTLILAPASQAANRNCTPDERKAANQQLLAIAADPSLQKIIANRHTPFGLHLNVGSSVGEQTYFQNGYILEHDTDLRTTLWVSYRLTKLDRQGAAGKDRVNCFRKDPRIARADTATTTDYNEPIFDQGHMTNDADLKDDLIEQINTYMMSNMSPQHCRFNRGIWLSLEHLTRTWADTYEDILVTSGAIFDRDSTRGRDVDSDAVRMESRNGKKRVAVPSHYYKVFLRETTAGWQSIAFTLQNNNDKNGVDWTDVEPIVMANIVSLSDIEAQAGLQLHPTLDRSNLVESLDGANWDFSGGLSNAEATCR